MIRPPPTSTLFPSPPLSRSPDTDGPITVPGGAAGPLRPQSYDGTVGPVTGAVSEVFSGPNSPIREIGIVPITTSSPTVVVIAPTSSTKHVARVPDTGGLQPR